MSFSEDGHKGKILATRKSGNVIVCLAYDFGASQVEIIVNAPTEDFILYPENSRALDCFHHPYAYADFMLKSGRCERVRHEDFHPVHTAGTYGTGDGND